MGNINYKHSDQGYSSEPIVTEYSSRSSKIKKISRYIIYHNIESKILNAQAEV
jgi:hypothetical protein